MSRSDQEDNGSGRGRRRHYRIAPEPGHYDGFEIVEIRPKRKLRIQHLKPNKPKIPEVQTSPTDNESDKTSTLQKRPSANSNQIEVKSVNSVPMRATTISDTKALDNENRISYDREKTPTSVRQVTISEETQKRLDNKNTVIFFFHGVGGSSDVWMAQMKYFCNHGYEVVAPDLLGHGFSSTLRNESAYTFFELYRDLIAVFDKYCTEKTILVGHSYGASFCAKIATERRSNVKKLVLISGGAPLPLKPTTCQVFCLPTPILTCCHPCLDYYFHQQAFHSSAPSQEERMNSFDVPTYVLRGIVQGQIWPEGDEEYHSLLTPQTLLIHGSRDGLVSKDEEMCMKETIYGCEMEEVINAGHMVMIECPDIVNSLIHNFITKHEVQTVKQHPRPVTAKSVANLRRETKVVL